MRKPKTITAKLHHGRVHSWLKCQDMTLQSKCGINVRLEATTRKGFQWPACARCFPETVRTP